MEISKFHLRRDFIFLNPLYRLRRDRFAAGQRCTRIYISKKKCTNFPVKTKKCVKYIIWTYWIFISLCMSCVICTADVSCNVIQLWYKQSALCVRHVRVWVVDLCRRLVRGTPRVSIFYVFSRVSDFFGAVDIWLDWSKTHDAVKDINGMGFSGLSFSHYSAL